MRALLCRGTRTLVSWHVPTALHFACALLNCRTSVASVRRAEEFAFLEGACFERPRGVPGRRACDPRFSKRKAELLPWLEPDQPPATRRGAEKEGKARGGTSGKKAGQNPTMLDQFVAQRTKEDSPDEAGEDDEFGDGVDGELIDHADGTMSLGAPTEAPP